jgi:hypothetical protein
MDDGEAHTLNNKLRFDDVIDLLAHGSFEIVFIFIITNKTNRI